MAFRLVGGMPDSHDLEGTVTSGVAIAAGDVLAINGNVLERATSSSTIHTIVGVASETITTAATLIKYKLIQQGQLWEADTANNTDSTERYESCALTDHDTLDILGVYKFFLIVLEILKKMTRRKQAMSCAA